MLEIKDFCLWYGEAQALFNVEMKVPRGKVTALIGPSGCGKSTLLRSVNRINDLIDIVRIKGDMLLNGESIYDPAVDVIELRKRMGMVFQKPNPFPMSIYENVIYPLRVDGIRDKRVLDEVCEQSLRGAALWDEAKDRLNEIALGPLRRSAAAPLHRPRHRRGARSAADGRALLGPGPHRHRQDRRPHS
jgi:phosphate transport system ATP-binding protein